MVYLLWSMFYWHVNSLNCSCIECIITERMKQVRDTLADIDILDSACHTASSRLSSLRLSKVNYTQFNRFYAHYSAIKWKLIFPLLCVYKVASQPWTCLYIKASKSWRRWRRSNSHTANRTFNYWKVYYTEFIIIVITLNFFILNFFIIIWIFYYLRTNN